MIQLSMIPGGPPPGPSRPGACGRTERKFSRQVLLGPKGPSPAWRLDPGGPSPLKGAQESRALTDACQPICPLLPICPYVYTILTLPASGSNYRTR